nr:hypothetical protein [Ruegeria sp. PrR005]
MVESSKPKKVKGITPEAVARMEQEIARLQVGGSPRSKTPTGRIICT